MSIYVGNLPYKITEENLQEVFSEYGTVKRIHMPTDRDTGRMRGFAFVEMETDQEEESAISELDGAEWMERTLKVNKAKPKKDSGSHGNRRNNRFAERY